MASTASARRSTHQRPTARERPADEAAVADRGREQEVERVDPHRRAESQARRPAERRASWRSRAAGQGPRAPLRVLPRRFAAPSADSIEDSREPRTGATRRPANSRRPGAGPPRPVAVQPGRRPVPTSPPSRAAATTEASSGHGRTRRLIARALGSPACSSATSASQNSIVRARRAPRRIASRRADAR